MPPIYFSIRTIQPFADLSSEPVDGEPGVSVVRADGDVCGLRLEDPRLVVRLDGIIEKIGVEPERVWNRLRADADFLTNRRQATYGQRGNM